MKKALLLLAGLFIAMAFCHSVLAQTSICITYDAAGNRINRISCSAGRGTSTADRTTESETETLSVQLQPNPASDHFTLIAEEAPSEAPVFIFDELGHILLQTRLGNGYFDISAFPAGLYFVRIVSDGKQKTLTVEKTQK